MLNKSSSLLPISALNNISGKLWSIGLLAYCLSFFTADEKAQVHKPDFENVAITAFSSTGPVSLQYASYYGSSINNVFNDVVVDASGNIYATGSTISQGFDAVVVKYDASGSLQWQTLIGGTDADNFNANDTYNYGKIAIDPTGNVYVTGITESDNFPTVNAFQASRGGGIDAFVTKLDNDGNILMSSYLGGAGDENFGGSGGISVDAAGNIIIAGSTYASGFFDSSTAYQTTFGGGTNSDAFIVKISPDFSSLSGTYWGDEGTEVIRDLAIASDGTIYLGGYSEESNLSLPDYQSTIVDVEDGMILGFSADLSTLTKGTFFGGQFDDAINSIAIDNDDNVLVAGSTFSVNDFPTKNAFQAAYTGGEEAFAAKFNSSGQLTWSTFIGDYQNETANTITTDAAGNVYLGGVTSSVDFPVHRTVQETYNTLTCEDDAFIFKFNPDGTRDWSTFYGGWRREQPLGIAVNNANEVILVGRTESTDLPLSTDAELTTAFASGINAFVSVFAVTCPSRPILIHTKENALYHDQFWCNNYNSPYNHYFQSDTCALSLIAPPGYINYSWTRDNSPINGADQRTLSIPNPYSATALPEYRVIINDGNDCTTASESIPTVINWVRPMCGFGSSFDKSELPHQSEIIEGYEDVFICPSETLNATLTADGFCGASYQWQKDFEDIPGATNANLQITEPGCYRIAMINDFTGCTVYSPTKKYIPLQEVYLNDYYLNQPESCGAQDTIRGCTNVRIEARVPHCAACDQSPRQGLIYTFFRDGVEVADNTYGYYSTTEEGNYTVEVSNGTCSFTSNTLQVLIQPTEAPIWISPIDYVCISGSDSITFAVNHPAIGDSATLRFDFPYPASDVITMDSFVRVASSDLAAGCMDVRLTTRDGCTSRSIDIELHDTIPPLIQVDGAACVPVRLRSQSISSCHLDSVFWYHEDTLVLRSGYDASYVAQVAGHYQLRIKNECGDFYSDSIYLSEELAAPVISPEGPICLPANLSIPDPGSDIVVRWYRNATNSYCYQNNNYLIPNEEDVSMIANLPGYYYAALEDTLSGCVSSCSNVVEVQRSVAGANIVPSNDIYFCDGTGSSTVSLSVQPASSSYTYQWYRNNDPISGATLSTYTTSAEGVYRVYLENSCDNAFTPVINIFSVANPNLSIDRPDTTYLCGPDTIRLDVNNDQPLIFEWYKDDVLIVDAIDSFFLAVEPGKYQVYGLNNNTQCETYSQEVYIINSIPLNTSISASAACNGPCSGSLSAAVSGGIPFPGNTYQYEWETGATSATITDLCVGTYSVTITDAIGCSSVRSATVEAGFSISPTLDSISCAGSADGMINITTNGGQAPFTYNWSTGGNSNQIEDLGPGTYSITVTDAQSCQHVESITLVEPTALSINLTAEAVSCTNGADGSINAIVSGGQAPYNYDWSTSVIADSAMLAAGNYSLTITDANNCQMVESITVDEPSPLNLALNITNTSACAGDADGAISATVDGGTAPYQYLWSDGEIVANRSDLADGNFILTITDANGCTITDQINLSPIDSLKLEISNTHHVGCWGGNDGSLSLVASGGTAPFQYYLNGVSQSTSTFSNLEAGDYSVYVEDANGCNSGILAVEINSPDTLVVTYDINPASCRNASDGSVAFQVNGGSPEYAFAWEDGVTTSARTDLGRGSYTVTVSDVQLCEQIINLTIEAPDTLATTFTINNVRCFEGMDGGVEIVETSGGTPPYEYYLDGDMLPPAMNQLDQHSAGSYVLRTVDANGCERSDNVEIIEPDILVASIEITQSLTCFGGSDAALVASVSGGTAPYSYTWSNGSNTINAIDVSAGTYSVTITDAQDCITNTSILLSEGPFIEVQIVEVIHLSCMGAMDGSLELLGVGGTAPYHYFVNGVQTGSSQISSLAPGNYEVYVQDTNGCISDLQSILLTEPEELSGSVDTRNALCFGANDGVAMIEVSGGTAPYTFNWNSGHEDAVATDLVKGSYEVSINDAQGCSYVLAFEIDSPDAIVSAFFVQDNPCYDDALGVVRIETTSGGTAPYTYYLDSERLEDSVKTIDGLPAGVYELITIDANNCAVNDELVIEEPDLFSLRLNEDQTIKLGERLPLDLEINNGIGELTIEFDPETFIDCENGSSLLDCPSPSIVLPTRNMVYEVTLTDDNGCQAQDEIRVVVDRSKEPVFMPNIFTPNDDGENDIFYVHGNPSIETVYEFIIMDRWGDQVFAAKNFLPNDPGFGWNGYLKGQVMNVGVYIWSIHYRTIDGEEYRISGDVTLLR